MPKTNLKDLKKIYALLDWIQFSLVLGFSAAALYTILYGIGILNTVTSVLFAGTFILLQFFKIKLGNLAPNTSARFQDPIFTLSAKGVDLPEFSEFILDNLQSIDAQLQKIDEHITNLDEKIRAVHKDMEVIFQVVTLLATEEVNLIDIVNDATNEIKFMFEIINAVIEEIEDRNETMEEMVRQSSIGAQKVNKTSSVIQHLSESSGGMLKMIDFINGITKKTNLLAINASIEATHSGDSGKGFTVIAEEMRNLAILTSQNAKEISRLLLNSIEEYSEASIVSKESGESFAFINAGVQSVHGTIAEVLQTIAELKTRGGVVVQKTTKMDQVAVKVKNTSGEVYGEVVLMTQNLNEIEELSRNLKIEADAIKDTQAWQVRLTKKFREKVEGFLAESDELMKQDLGNRS